MGEFSFPSVALKEPQNDPIFFPASPLWFLSSPQTVTHFRRSFSSADGIILSPNNIKRENFVPGSPALSDYGTIDPKLGILDDGFDAEERMDSLWEQFNNFEAFIESNFDGDKKISRRRSIGVMLGLEATVRNEKMSRIRTLKRVQAVNGRKPNLVEMLGMLKKWFVAHGSRQKLHHTIPRASNSA
ncbi:hypothetical protein LUZ63_008895 [Rhynchospora breviuscula]|uniref:Uncharacterized protein n=1 Tax=Rhynchospora breviuscula TaxID=2022672 RepID=A0A9Q0CED4_9POAL|nr:hypothetical protein LUZ63_008895 [Rhynchospora breviuscula]